MMAAILDRHEPPDVAAAEWLKANPTALKAWLDGVLTLDGRPALTALVHSAPPPHPGGFEQWIVSHKIPVGDAMATAIDTIKAHGTVVFDEYLRLYPHDRQCRQRAAPCTTRPGADCGCCGAPDFGGCRRSLPLADLCRPAALLFFLNQGYWAATLETLALVLVATVASAAIGVPMGIAAAHRPRLYAALRPVLDLMQTLPTFVYLIPTLVLFGFGRGPGFDIDGDFCAAGPHSPHAPGDLVRSKASDRGRRGIRRNADAAALES